MIRAWIERDPGRALVLLALVLAAALYAPTIPRGILNHDDQWLLRDNWIAQDASVSSLRTIAFDTSRPVRAVLGAEYLPVRDAVWMIEFAAWGRWWPGFHLVNLIVYLAAIALWFAAFTALGIDRRLSGVAILLWALHPTHAESVAWLSELKGLLALALAGACALGYARWRGGGAARWLVLAAASAACAVWSKAPAAFAIAALAGLELALPARRASWRRALVGLAVVGAVTAAAFVPVVLVALRMSVVGNDDRAPAGWFAMALGAHGFYLRLGALGVSNAASYPIRTLGPAWYDVALGALGLVAVVAGAILPRRVPEVIRAACVLWLFGWFPASRILLPLRHVLVADRYLSFATFGLALAAAYGVCAIASRRARVALLATLVLASSLSTLAAQDSWRNSVALWARAVESNPDDGEAWGLYYEQLAEAGDQVGAADALARGLARTRHSRLLVDKAIELYGAGRRDEARALFVEGAQADDPYAMNNLGLVLLSEGDPTQAVRWSRRALASGGEHAEFEDGLCQTAAAAGERAEAISACERALVIRPHDPTFMRHLAAARH
jgi:tetratricopeptide (TPR) repeat protein